MINTSKQSPQSVPRDQILSSLNSIQEQDDSISYFQQIYKTQDKQPVTQNSIGLDPIVDPDIRYDIFQKPQKVIYLNEDQLNEIKKKSFQSFIHLQKEAELNAFKIKELITDVEEIQKVQSNAQRIFHIEETIKTVFSDKMAMVAKSLNIQDSKLLQLQQQLFKLNQEIEQKLSLTDIHRIGDIFRKEFPNRMMFDQEIQRIDQKIDNYQSNSVQREDFVRLQQQFEIFQREIFSNIMEDLQPRIKSMMENALSKYCLRGTFDQRNVVVDFQIRKLQSDQQLHQSSIQTFVEELAKTHQNQTKDIINQCRIEMKVMEQRLDQTETRIRQEIIQREALILEQIFQQLEFKFPDQSNDIQNFKTQISEMFTISSENSKRVAEVRKQTQINFEKQQQILASKVDQSDFLKFKQEAENTYLNTLRGAEMLYRLITLENQQKQSRENFEDMMTQLLAMVEKTKTLNQNVENFMALNPEEFIQQVKVLNERFNHHEADLIEKLSKSEYLMQADRQGQYVQKYLAQYQENVDDLRNQYTKSMELFYFHYQSLFNVKTQNVQLKLEEQEKHQRYLVKQIEKHCGFGQYHKTVHSTNISFGRTIDKRVTDANDGSLISEFKFMDKLPSPSALDRDYDEQIGNTPIITTRMLGEARKEIFSSQRPQSHQRCKRQNAGSVIRQREQDKKTSIFNDNNQPLIKKLDRLSRTILDAQKPKEQRFLSQRREEQKNFDLKINHNVYPNGV